MAKYQVNKAYGNINAELSGRKKGNLEGILKQHGEPIKLEQVITIRDILELDKLNSFLVQDSVGNLFKLDEVPNEQI